MRQIILASQSPRRNDLVGQMGIPFSVIPSDYDEQLDDTRSPEIVACELGLGKALAVAQKYPEAIVIGSDTIVSLDSRQLGKPRDRAHAREMLQDVSGRENVITSSVAVVCLAEGVEVVEAETARLLLKPFDADKVEAYLDTGDYADKAAAYGVQSGFAPLVAYIDGDYDTIIGLPTRRLAHILQTLGVPASPVELVAPLPQKKRSR